MVGAGRGVGGADGFDDVLELTDLLGGVAGRLPGRDQPRLAAAPRAGRTDRQPGHPGPLRRLRHQRCDPALGGHVGPKTILAINTDPDAPMVTKAHYAVIGDLHEIVPAINAEIRRRGFGG